jgi:hypothetical protein
VCRQGAIQLFSELQLAMPRLIETRSFVRIGRLKPGLERQKRPRGARAPVDRFDAGKA